MTQKSYLVTLTAEASIIVQAESEDDARNEGAWAVFGQCEGDVDVEVRDVLCLTKLCPTKEDE